MSATIKIGTTGCFTILHDDRVGNDGDPLLAAHWVDLDLNPATRAFYYALVINIPTPRWTDYDVKRFGIKIDPKAPVIIRNAPTPHRFGTRRNK